MQTKRRRRLDVVVLGMGALAGGVVTAIGGAVGDGERVSGMWVGATLGSGGTAEVVEVIDYDFGLAFDKHGIFRRVPGLGPESPVQITSGSAPAGLADRTAHVFEDGERGVEWKIGDPDRTVSGRHRYRIIYPHPGLLTPTDALEWDAVGTGWTATIGRAEVHLVAPWTFASATCAVGRRGSSDACEIEQVEPGHLVATVDRSLRPGNGVSVFATRGADLDAAPMLPAPPDKAPPDPGAGLLMPAVASIAAGVGSMTSMSRLLRRAGRERVGAGGGVDAAWSEGGPGPEVRLDHRELAAMATTEFAPPPDLSAAQGGVILAERVRTQHKVAWLIQAAIDGGVELVESGGRKKQVRLVRADGAELDPILASAFGKRREIQLGSYDPKFAKAWARIGSDLSQWGRRSGLWDPKADHRTTVARVLGGFATLLGAGIAALGGALAARYGREWMPVVVLGGLVGGGGFAALIRGWELRVRTPQGSGQWLRVESFRRFLAGSEAHHAEEAARMGLLREYTAWAVAVGEIDRWERAVSASTAIPAEAGLSYVHLAPVLGRTTSATATEPSSSGGGGGGGGSVGGGGGGGGGGSW